MKWDPQKDKVTELLRYDARARSLLAHIQEPRGDQHAAGGAASVDPILRAPYLLYEQWVRDVVRPGHEVLELGAGTGLHTGVLLEAGARVTAVDISPNALAVLERNLGARGAGRLRTSVGDIEAPPFGDASFDVVTCVGSLSYGDPMTIDAAVRRILKPGGAFICVDSLNDNPIYRLNRWIHYLRGARTRSTVVRMATVARVQSIARHFASADVRYFGALSWAMPLAAWIVGPDRAASLSAACDRLLRPSHSAFKFVLVARGRQ